MRRGGTHTCYSSFLVLCVLLFAAVAANTPCSLPPTRGPGGLLVSDVALPDGLLDILLPGTELLQDIEALAARLGERGEVPFALVRMWDGSADDNPTDLAAVRTYVERGGLLVAMGGTDTSRLLNNLFGWEIVTYKPDDWWRALASDVSGTCFDMEVIPMLEPYEEPHFAAPTKLSSLPPEARSIYSSASDSHAAVAEVGAGRVVWFATDWGGTTWNNALLAALRMGSGVHADAAPRLDDLVFEGLRLVPLGATVRSKPGSLCPCPPCPPPPTHPSGFSHHAFSHSPSSSRALAHHRVCSLAAA